MASLEQERPPVDRSGGPASDARDGGFVHEAAFYGDMDSFLAATVPFLRLGLAANQPMLVMVDIMKATELRAALGGDSRRVAFADMSEVGRNPARILPAWQQFVQDNSSDEQRPLRGIGEPIWSSRSDEQVIEAQIHEVLLNRAFAGRAAMSLLCPYDTSTLSPEVIAEAERAHPLISEEGAARQSNHYDESCATSSLVDRPLSPAPEHAVTVPFDDYGLKSVRELVRHEARAAGIDDQRAADLGLSVNELATNSLEHGGGTGILTVWRRGDTLMCDVSDEGHIDDPLTGRLPPAEHEVGGRGLYLANQLCDLVQVRSSPGGTTVRVHMATG
ncbi:MAG TPA: sensor histidine kinase [Acidimicrobiales bacterium]|nr:sensor histidine kinase [Acidimicrobiales bacterium]